MEGLLELARENKVFEDWDLLCHMSIPVDRHVVKKNGRTIFQNGKRLFPGKSKELREAEKHLIQKMSYIKGRCGIRVPIDFDVWIMFWFIFPKEEYYTKKGVRKKTLPDLSNLYELPQDCLETAKVLSNDSYIVSHDGSRRLPGDKWELQIRVFQASKG